jgi:Zn-dependent M28 family amino/carboxypeptidase
MRSMTSTTILIILISLISPACSSSQSKGSGAPTATASPASAETQTPKRSTPFDAERAFAHVKAQVDIGPRPAGSAALEKAREYITRELKSYDLPVSLLEFQAQTPKGKVAMKNIIAELPGSSPEVIILASHYDTKLYKEFTFLGANDGGSSTGALLEIARVLKQQGPRKYTYRFVFFDGEEAFCGSWSECLDGKDNTYGSRHMADHIRATGELKKIKAVILLDMIGDKDLTIPREQSSSGWLVDVIWGTAAELGYQKEFPSRTFAVGDDDHMPFIRAGVPAVDIIDLEYGVGLEDNRYWHTKEDTLDKLSPRSLKIVGDIVILSLPRIESQIR